MRVYSRSLETALETCDYVSATSVRSCSSGIYNNVRDFHARGHLSALDTATSMQSLVAVLFACSLLASVSQATDHWSASYDFLNSTSSAVLVNNTMMCTTQYGKLVRYVCACIVHHDGCMR